MNEASVRHECDDMGKEWPQIIAVLTASMITLSSGIFFSWTSPSIPIMLSDEYPLDITMSEASYLTIIPAIAVVLVSPLSGRIIDIFGRKKSLLLTAIPQIMAWCLIIYGGSIYVFYVSRILSGIADSFCFAVVPTYISEVSTPRIRGGWGNAITFTIYFGGLIMNTVGAYLSIRTTSYICLTIPVIFICVCLFMPETPYFLLMKERSVDAEKSLIWLRRKCDVQDELKQLTADVQRQQSESGRYKDLFVIQSNRKAIIIGCIIRGAQLYSGFAALSMYTQIIFKESGSDFSPSISTIIFSGFLTLANFMSAFVIGTFGRRIPMLVSCTGSGITLTLLTIYFYINDNTSIDLQAFKLFPLIMMVIYVLFYMVGLGIIPTLMIGELFSSSIKGKAMCIMNASFGLFICTSTQIFSFLLIRFGLWVPFMFFSICCFLSIISSYCLVPETKGKSLEEIQQNLKSKSKREREPERDTFPPSTAISSLNCQTSTLFIYLSIITIKLWEWKRKMKIAKEWKWNKISICFCLCLTLLLFGYICLSLLRSLPLNSKANEVGDEISRIYT